MTRASSNTPPNANWKALGLASLVALACMQPALAGSSKGPNSNSLATIAAEYAADCKSALVTSSKDISNIVSVLSSGSWQKFDDLPEVESYRVAVDTSGPDADAFIVTLFVKSGSFKQVDPSGVVPGQVGVEMPSCTPA